MFLSVLSKNFLSLAWCSDHFLGETFPGPDYLLGKEYFPNTQSKHPLTEFHALPSGEHADAVC